MENFIYIVTFKYFLSIYTRILLYILYLYVCTYVYRRVFRIDYIFYIHIYLGELRDMNAYLLNLCNKNNPYNIIIVNIRILFTLLCRFAFTKKHIIRFVVILYSILIPPTISLHYNFFIFFK